MAEMERIADQVKRAFERDAWHGPAVLEVLEGVSAAEAKARPIAGAHTIWEIVCHMATWKRVVARRLTEGKSFEVPDDVDWPPVKDTGDAAWRAALADLRSAQDELLRAVGSAPERRLDEPLVPDGNHGYLQLHGVVQHDLYHAGQIVMLKKAVARKGAGAANP